MEAPNECNCERVDAAKRDLHAAEVEMERAEHDLERAQHEVLEAAEHMRKAEAEIHEAEECSRTVEVKVDGRPHMVKRGTYAVSAFKLLVGVASDRELDIVRCESFVPLDDGGEITICGHEVFISHVRTGASS